LTFQDMTESCGAGIWRQCALLCLSCLLFCCLAATAWADGIGGTIDYSYGLSKITTTDANGTTKIKGNSFSQNYSLVMDKSLTSTIRLMAGSRIQISKNDSETDGQSSSSDSTRISPYASLDYTNNMFSAGGGVSRIMVDNSSGGFASPTSFRDSYNARLSWKPEDLPTFNLMYSSFDLYDEHRTTQDLSSKALLFSSNYVPLKSVRLDYSATYSTSSNRLQGFDTESTNQNLRTSYSDTFLDNRLLFSTSYSIALQSATIKNKGIASGSGQLSTQVLPLPNAGYFGISTPPATPAQGALDSRPEVVNGNANTAITLATASATANPLNFGMQFNGAVDASLKLNVIRVLVTSNLANQQDLEGKAALLQGAFVWSVYVSDNNADWTPVTVTSQRFTNFVDAINPGGVFGFEINFNTISAVRYIKAVIRPAFLSDTALPLLTSVSVSKLEAYLNSIPTPVGTSKSSSQASGLFDMNLRAMLLNVPLITYDLGFNLSHNKGDDTAFSYRYNVVNGLSLYHTFNTVFSTSARVSREDGVEPDSTRSANLASISFTATPLPTLTHSLNISGRKDTNRGISRTAYSISSSNSADLYRGVSTNLSVTGSLSDSSSGESQKSVQGSMGLSLVPHKSLTITMGGTLSKALSSGGGKPESTTTNKGADISISYNPLPALYLFLNSSISDQTGQAVQTTTSFGGGWSPFRDGALQISTAYNETIQSGSKTRSFSQNARWKISQWASLSVGYLLSITKDSGQESESEGVNAALRILF